MSLILHVSLTRSNLESDLGLLTFPWVLAMGHMFCIRLWYKMHLGNFDRLPNYEYCHSCI